MEHDHTQSLQITANMRDAVNAMNRMASDVGVAYQVKELSSHRRENLLAKYVAKAAALDSRGKPIPMSSRESEARNNPEYHAEFEELAKQLSDSFILIKQWDVQDRRYEAARSLLSFSKRMKWETDGP